MARIVFPTLNHLKAHWFPILAGTTLIAVGLIANEWVLARIFSPDGSLSTRSRLVVWFLDVVFVAMGVVVISFRQRLLHNERESALFRHPNFVALMLGCAMSVVALGVVEGIFYTLSAFGEPSPFVRTRDAALTATDELLGHRPEPNGVYHESYALGDETIFDVEYTIDSNRCRVVPGQGDKESTQFLLICGGSFAFGTGVEDDESMAALVAKEAEDYRVYNLANLGDGPHQTLAILDQWDMRSFVKEETGIAIYVFIPQHIPRAVGTMRHVATWGWEEPTYLQAGGGAMTYAGSYREARPWRWRFYNVLAKEQALQYFGRDFPPASTDKHLYRTANILKAAESMMKERLGSERFYVLLHPLLEDSGVDMERIREVLQESGLRVLDYYDAIEGDRQSYFYPGDLHPTAKTHRLIADRVLVDLGLD